MKACERPSQEEAKVISKFPSINFDNRSSLESICRAEEEGKAAACSNSCLTDIHGRQKSIVPSTPVLKGFQSRAQFSSFYGLLSHKAGFLISQVLILQKNNASRWFYISSLQGHGAPSWESQVGVVRGSPNFAMENSSWKIPTPGKLSEGRDSSFLHATLSGDKKLEQAVIFRALTTQQPKSNNALARGSSAPKTILATRFLLCQKMTAVAAGFLQVFLLKGGRNTGAFSCAHKPAFHGPENLEIVSENVNFSARTKAGSEHVQNPARAEFSDLIIGRSAGNSGSEVPLSCRALNTKAALMPLQNKRFLQPQCSHGTDTPGGHQLRKQAQLQIALPTPDSQQKGYFQFFVDKQDEMWVASSKAARSSQLP
ncbi:hypothetical protein Anapl_15214 [Anas platyrhynchos]|uniref:Uncharacterized protein n=1 Tax=Anas platyrhynchos TaxID=8839 RepID=R0JLN3_ANAPL|nr:hypothetical protein Anapl_15214 [Anas platyrhynchos]